MSATFLMNSPVLTSYGRFRFDGPIPPNQAALLVSEGFVSAIGHAGAAQLLSELLGIEVPVSRVAIRMAPGDRAIVLRLLNRLGEGEVLDRAGAAAVPYELGLLTRTE